jgi:hypothetical protein
MSGVVFSEICRILRLYIKALTGEDIGIEIIKEPFQKYPHPVSDSIILPEQIQEFSSWEENFWLYKVYTSHQLGYFLYDSFSLSHEQFFLMFSHPDLAAGIFYLLEDGRVDSYLQREYQGLGRDIKKFRQEWLIRDSWSWNNLWTKKIEGMIWDRLFKIASSTKDIPLVPNESLLGKVVTGVINQVATVYDTALGTSILYTIISQSLSCHREHSSLQPEKALSATIPWGKKNNDDNNEDNPYSCPPESMDIESLLLASSQNSSLIGQDFPIPWEYLKELLTKGANIELREILLGLIPHSSGLFVTQLSGFTSTEANPEPDNPPISQPQSLAGEKIKPQDSTLLDHSYYYDEWDYLRHDYRLKWCRLTEIFPESGSSNFVDQVLEQYSFLIDDLKRQFQKLRPQKYIKKKRLFAGEEVDLDALIEEVVDKKSGSTPTGKIYIERRKLERDVGAVFLLDMSASTDDCLPDSQKRIIDIEKEAMILMAEAMESLGDKYAIFGFSGYGRNQVEFFIIKEFSEQYSQITKSRIEGIKPCRSTRMGPAIRHAVYKLKKQGAKFKLLLLLSDGYPQDFDYGEDRTNRDYGLHDTMISLKEAERSGIKTFCLTVDPSGHDYLRTMCRGLDYLVIKHIEQLPQELPKIYYNLTI